ncbi:MAG: TatD family hydrolase [candidate division Zixibacteria bacterium]|nr:TatD family hydrolase [candidate division Zixibacteria bacterium]MBU1470184.1 TatD family hydrolase [candidate division Zixibacteria bacterium]MBU2625945.1 TatD family hydrolase [candidate division Zixibacteria bacterium]
MIDTHAHIDFPNFDDDRNKVIKSAFDVGLSAIINVGVDVETSRASVELAENNKRIYAVVGCHPHDSGKFTREDKQTIERLAQHPKVVAIGEIGLDYYRDHSPRDIQQQVFAEQIIMARNFELPMVVHIRDAMPDALRILREQKAYLVGGVLHCFPGTAEDAQKATDMNLLVSFGGSLTFKKSRSAAAAAEVPIENIILETDCPFMTPEPFRGKRNEPAYVRYAYKALASIRNLPLSTIEKTVDENARRLFNIADDGL